MSAGPKNHERNMGYVALARGREGEALEVFESVLPKLVAMGMHDSALEVYHVSANTYVRRGDVATALDHYLRAMLHAKRCDKGDRAESLSLVVRDLLGNVPPGARERVERAIEGLLAGELQTEADLLGVAGDLSPVSQSGGKGKVGERALEKLKKLVRVSDSLRVEQMARILGLDEAVLLDKIVDWAYEFGFRIDQDVVRFSVDGSSVEMFVEELEREFRAWDEEPGGKR
ncbi:MAG: hypothetical protein ACTSU5_20265 [Promethearchaeota archaeon]